jgi:hypothetical protein
MKVSTTVLIFFLATALYCYAAKSTAKDTSLYDAQKSTVLLLTRENFDKQVTKHRAKLVSIIHYYKHDGIIWPKMA